MLNRSDIDTEASRRIAGAPTAGAAQSSGQARLCWCAGVPPTSATRRTGAGERATEAAADVPADPDEDGPTDDAVAAAGAAVDAPAAAGVPLDENADEETVAAAGVMLPGRPAGTAGADVEVVAVLPAALLADEKRECAAAARAAAVVAGGVAVEPAAAGAAADTLRRTDSGAVRTAAGARPATGTAGSAGARLAPVVASRWMDNAGRISPSALRPRWP